MGREREKKWRKKKEGEREEVEEGWTGYYENDKRVRGARNWCISRDQDDGGWCWWHNTAFKLNLKCHPPASYEVAIV